MSESFPRRVIRVPRVLEKTGLPYSSLYAKLDPESPRHDPTFPERIPLGARAVGFLEEAVDAWIEAQRPKKGRS